MISIKKSGLRALIITLFTMLIISSLVVLVKAKNSSSEVKEVEKTAVLAQQWFKYTGPDQSRSEIENPENYQLLSEEPPCTEGAELCAVHTTNNGGTPDLSTSFVDEIMNALSSAAATAAIKLEN